MGITFSIILTDDGKGTYPLMYSVPLLADALQSFLLAVARRDN